MSQNEMQHAVDPRLFRLIVCNFRACRFQQVSVLDTGRTGCLTGAATEASIDMSFERGRIGLESSFFDGTHQVDAPARAVIFVRRHHIGGTRFKTEATVNTGKNLFFFVREGCPKRRDDVLILQGEFVLL